MKRILGSLCLGLLVLGSCVSKKRTTYGKDAGKKGSNVSESQLKPGEVLPEDPGKFVYFSIESADAYIHTFSEVAKFEMKQYGIPASITLAQGLLESGFGRGELARKTNNHFGIKCHTGWDGDYARHDDDARGECFRKYNHPMYSYRDHSLFLTTRSRYSSLFDLRPDDYKAWAKGLKKAGYATDRKYPSKLIQLIERYDLQRFDAEVLGRDYIASSAPALDNGYHAYRVQKGDTLFAISRRYYLSVEELMRLNDLSSSEISIGQVLKVPTEKVRK
ncbi:MAG: glucosaminidase domain-containing protein [Robiginitalea sp.]|jgi:flagellum-specific peptidoglycan hydrolase FlgJ